MAISKVVYGGNTLLDLTSDTVTSSTLKEGITAHGKNGELITGKLAVKTYYTSSSEPTASNGEDGDLWLVV